MKKRIVSIISVVILIFGFGILIHETTGNVKAEEETVAKVTENEATASFGDDAAVSGVYPYNEIAMSNGAITLSNSELNAIKNNSSVAGLKINSTNGAIIMDSSYIASLVDQSKGTITFSYNINGSIATVSAKTEGSTIYGNRGLCLISADNHGDFYSTVLDSNGVAVGTSCYFEDANMLRWQMVKSETYMFYSNKVSFLDTENHWSKDYVGFLASRGVVNGVSIGYFSPDSNVTRGQFIAILHRISKDNGVAYTNNPYDDVLKDQYYYNAVCWGTDAKIINGRSASKFEPNANISREEMATMCCRYLNSLNMDLKAVRTGADFSDISSVMPYAVTPVKQCHAAGIINGVGGNRFDPQANATRGESATIVAGLIAYLTAMPH
ncbi:MAG: S-layer homology domain-containing protein [Clostridiales bacterium]